MKHLALILSIPLLVVTGINAAPFVFIVRHAEKASTSDKDPDLSLQGQKHADSKRLGSQRRSAFLRTIIPKSLSYCLAIRRSCCGCIIHFDKDAKVSCAEKFFLLLDPDPDGKSCLHIERRKPN